ncbi:MAG: hypothetical protein WCT04_12510 [Planctomycetota bacterium]
MNCHWCEADSLPEGPANRCQQCGGAHWLCMLCGTRLVPESKRFCSFCGTQRTQPRELNPTSAPHMSVIRQPLGIKRADHFEAQTGFCIRAVDGCWVAGRLLLTGAKDMLISPGVIEKGNEHFQILQTIGKQLALDLTIPRVLEEGTAIVGGASGLFAVSTHMDDVAQALVGRPSQVVPLVIAKSGAPTHVFAVVAESGSRDGKFVHLIYHPSNCLEVGCFESAGEMAIPRNLVAMVDVLTDPAGGEPEIWFMFEDRKSRAVIWRSMKAPYTQFTEGETSVMNMLPRLGLNHTTMHAMPNTICYVLNRSGISSEDGAWAVSKNTERNASREIERPAGTLVSRPPFELYEAGGMGPRHARSRALDGSWVRIGSRASGTRWSWCAVGDDAVSFSVDPNQVGWDSEQLEKKLGFWPGPNDVGPVIPTPWGLATCALSGETMNLIYLDFQTSD